MTLWEDTTDNYMLAPPLFFPLFRSDLQPPHGESSAIHHHHGQGRRDGHGECDRREDHGREGLPSEHSAQQGDGGYWVESTGRLGIRGQIIVHVSSSRFRGTKDASRDTTHKGILRRFSIVWKNAENVCTESGEGPSEQYFPQQHRKK